MAPLNINVTGNGTTLYLYNSTGAPVVDGAATGITTTPFMLYNDGWTTTAPVMELVYSGGPPFRSGSTPAYRSYQNVQEQFTVELYCSSHNTAVARMQQLAQVLNTALFTAPCVLAITPSGATNTMYTEVYQATVQPLAQFNNLVNPVSGWTTIGIQISITRSPFFGLLSSGETLINAQTMTNTGSGALNTKTLGTGAGDLIYEGGPLNLKITPLAAGTAIYTLIAASVYSTTYQSAVVGMNSSSAQPQVSGNPDFSAALTRPGIKARAIYRFSTSSSNAIFSVVFRGSGGQIIYQTPYRALPAVATSTIFDSGPLILDAPRRNPLLSGTSLFVDLYISTTGGGAATATLDSGEFLLYYDWCQIDTGATKTSSQTITASQFQERSNWCALPFAQTSAVLTSGNQLVQLNTIRGTLPRFWSGASLYLNWLDSTGKQANGDTATVTVTHAPLYKVFRGNG